MLTTMTIAAAGIALFWAATHAYVRNKNLIGAPVRRGDKARFAEHLRNPLQINDYTVAPPPPPSHLINPAIAFLEGSTMLSKSTIFIIIITALFAVTPATAGVKYVAVVETEIDMNPAEAAKLERSEVRLITDELRSTAVNALPQDRYSVMTTETVMAQSGPVLSECAEENCIITLGSKIGADYIVRGKLGKIGTLFTLSVSMFDTEDGFLVGTSKAIRSEKLVDLLEKAAGACADMYKKLAIAQNPTAQNAIPKPPATNTAAGTQNSAPKPRGTYSVTVGSQIIELVHVVGGTFVMGCTSEQGHECKPNEEPAHRVTVSDFFIGKYEVTQGLWKAVTGSFPKTANSKSGLGDNYPVYNISWQAVQAFIDSLNRKTGRSFRLPTEAEWEYAARGGNNPDGYKYSGGNNVVDVAWYSKNSGKTSRPVGTKWPNKLGIHDMSGNVREWVWDIYEKDYYNRSSTINPAGPSSGSKRVYRGGAWKDDAANCRVSYRNSSNPGGIAARASFANAGQEEDIDPFININSAGFRLLLSP
jgi:formylglycine-generating enzyme required for sulfatase activity